MECSMSGTEDGQALSHDDVREILDIVDRSWIGELRLELGDVRLHVRKTGVPGTELVEDRTAPAIPASSPEPTARDTRASTPAPLTPRQTTSLGGGRTEGDVSETALHVVTAPMVGVIYRASAPDQPPFVEVGDHVEADDTVCLIEVMKLFNSITAGVAGRVVEILADNGVTVEYDQPIVTIEPLESR
ncbi:MAG: acetyl-CoA carboxylase biotin carboxyl carrier protein [Streptosporangiales bacterium]|nr:acetyl-CoA carboxylase biotin carboxyl carrier protein [Streptosporangiales bacterium]